MPDASADCAFLPQLSQSLNDTQTFSAVFIISVPHSTRVRVQLPSSLSHFSFFLSSRVAQDFSSLLFMFPLLFTKCAGSFLFSQWLTIHHTPGRIRTHTAQILSLLSPAVGLLEQNHHRGSRTPSFWFVAKCFIH